VTSRLVLAIVLTILCGREALAGGEETPVPSALQQEIVITAARMEQERGRTGPTVSIVGPDDLEKRAVRLAAKGISVVAGAYVNMGGPPGSPTSLFLRGAGSNQTIVYLDGVQANDPTIGGQFNFYDLTVDNVERIEVLRGSASTLYGSDAIGGVVNVISRRGRGDPTFRGNLEVGSFGYWRVAAGGRGQVGPVDFSLDLSRLHIDNELPNNEFDDTTFAGTLGYEIIEGLRIELRGRYIDSAARDPWDFPFGLQIEEDPNIYRDRTTTLGAIGVRHDVTDRFSYRVDASLFVVDSRFENGPDAPGDPPEFVSESRGEITNVTAIGDYRDAELTEFLGGAALLGFEYEAQRSESEQESAFGPAPPIDRTVRNRALFGLLEATIVEDLFLSGGVRRDDNSFFGDKTTFSASGLYHLVSTGTRFRANYGEGFRAPTPVEFDDPFVGNPDLRPEESVSVDFGVEQDLLDGELNLTLTAFQLSVDDLIAWDFDTGRLENFRRTRTRGLEFAGQYAITPEILTRGWYTYQDPKNLDAPDGADAQLPGRPKWFGGGEVRYVAAQWWAALEVVTSDSFPAPVRITPEGDVRKSPGRKLLFALRGAWQINEIAAVTVAIENLFDYEYYEDVNRPDGLGRGLYVGLTLDF